MDQVRGSYWHGIFTGSGVKELFCPSFYLGIRERNTLGDLAYMLPFYCTVNGKRIESFLCLYYSSDIIKSILTDISEEDGTVSYLITDRDALVTSTDDTLSGIYHFNYEDIYEYLFSSNNYMEKKILGEKVYLSFKNIQRPGWFLINVVPTSIITKETGKTLYRYFLMVLLILLACLFISTRFSSSLAERISSVISTMAEIRKGSLHPMEEPRIKDEIGDLISTYNYMTNKQKTLTENLQQTADELRIAEVNALQAQINPHFLYNTLDTIQWMAMTGKDKEVSDTVQKLSRFYRLTLGRDMTNTTIEKEIEHASIYVDLQNIRFDDAITFIVDIPEELKSLNIPRLTLQPIVENAILHGIREKESQEGCIVITGWDEEDDIYLLVSDDGVGIKEDFLPKILSTEGMNPSTKGTNIAIYNVHHRLQLLYGNDYGLSYTSRIGEGTEVMIHLPKVD
jgi:two-component system sensor histidine kinase YesM